MKHIIDFLLENPDLFLATIGLDGKPKVRPFRFMFEDGGKLWFCTSNQKEVYAELQKNPFVEMSVTSSNHAWLRLSAKVIFEKNLPIKNKVIAQDKLVRSIYENGDNPTFEVFYLADGSAIFADFSDAPPKIVTL